MTRPRRCRRRRRSPAEVATVTYAELRRLNPAAARQKLLEAQYPLHGPRLEGPG